VMNFHGDWHPTISFDFDSTRLETFHVNYAKRVQVPMMKTFSKFIAYVDMPEIEAYAVSLSFDVRKHEFDASLIILTY